MSQVAHFLGHNSKALACFSGPGRLYGCVESQQIGLKGDVVNGLDNLGGLVGGFLNLIDGRSHALHGFHSGFHHPARVFHGLIRLFGIVGIVLDLGGHLFQAGRGLLQAGGLLVGPFG